MVFATSIGTTVDPDRLNKEYMALLGRAGLRYQRFHDLRHTAATLKRRDGCQCMKSRRCSDTGNRPRR
jgi:integrase